MIVKAKMASDYRGDPCAVITVSGGNRPGWRLTREEARELAADLLARADEADALMARHCTCGHLPGAHRGESSRLPHGTPVFKACGPDCACEEYTASA